MADDTPSRVQREMADDTPTRIQRFRQSVGLSGLSRQIFKKALKKGYEFNLMVCGEKGLGKSTLLQMLFETDSPPTSPTADQHFFESQTSNSNNSTPAVTVVPRLIEVIEHGINLKLTIIDTPGYAEHVDNRLSFQPLEQYIDSSFRTYMQDENRADRTKIDDKRVHCLLYFISPSSHGLRPVDVITMQKLHKKVNIVPVIAKADTLTQTELRNLKQKILEDINAEGITIFIPGFDDKDDSEQAQRANLRLMSSIPFALVGSNTSYEVDGSLVRGRKYPWGVVQVDNETHCDFGLLKQMLIKSHLHDLKGMTEEILYEQFRAGMLKKSGTTDTAAVTDTEMDGIKRIKSVVFKQKHQDFKRDLEEKSRLLDEQRQQLEDERKKFDLAAESMLTN